MKSIFIALVILNVVILAIVSYLWIKSDRLVNASKSVGIGKELRTINSVELSRYNGTDPNLPIYLVLDGYVYDISKGREFYQVGGPYHDLAGRDASKELHLVGGGIIKRKYPIVGMLK